jgi:hypothetical protein
VQVREQLERQSAQRRAPTRVVLPVLAGVGASRCTGWRVYNADVLSRLVWCCTRCRGKEGGGYERAGLRRVQGRDHCRHRHALAPGAPPFNCRTLTAINSIVHTLAISLVYPSYPPPPSLTLTRAHTQGFKFLGKAIKVTYARGTSDIVARANGRIPLTFNFQPTLRCGDMTCDV